MRKLDSPNRGNRVMKVSTLTNEGLKTFRNLLNSAKIVSGKKRYLEISKIADVRNEILNSKALCIELDGRDCGPPEKLPRGKLEAIQHINNILETCQVNPEKNVNLWSWFSVYYFFQLLDDLKEGSDQKECLIEADPRFILEPNSYSTYYRHLFAGPWGIFKKHNGNLNIIGGVLADSSRGSIAAPGDVYEQLAARQEIISSKSLLELVTDYYLDKDNMLLKTGAPGKEGGSARRFAACIRQFSRTWDFYGMESRTIDQLMPKEFDKYRSN
jgi:hypothetical protein